VPAPRVSVVIPALNEARNLPAVLPRLPAGIHEVILVDGRSTDGTADVARAIRADVRVVHQSGRGKGNALRAGFAAATGDIIVMLDADGSNDPGEIPQFVATLMAGADFAKGSRFLPGGGTSDMPFHRKLGNQAFVLMVRLLFGSRYTDLCYGYNAFWRRILPVLELDGDGFEIETEMNVRVLRAGLDVREVPSYEARRLYGDSNLQAIPDGLRVVRSILTERMKPLPDVGSMGSGAGPVDHGPSPELAPVPMSLGHVGVREAAGSYLAGIRSALEGLDLPAVLQLAERLRMAIDRGQTILLAADRPSLDVASRFVRDLRLAAAEAGSVLRVVGPAAHATNLAGRMETGDVVLLFAVDGNDPPTVVAAHAAQRARIDSVAVIGGADGGTLAQVVDHVVLTGAPIESVRAVVGLHAVLCDIVVTCLVHGRAAGEPALAHAQRLGSGEPAA